MSPVSPEHQGLYIHFPYCAHKCPYCDFNSHVVPHSDEDYADAILRELERRALDHPWGPFSTIYFGGGTPSLWAPAQVERIIKEVKASCGLVEDAEITLEANPGSALKPRLEGYVRAGVNRFSIGAQSFIDQELASLGRLHDAASAIEAVQSARSLLPRVSLDLIYAQPGQRWAQVQRSLDQALALDPEHISAYTLTIEPDTVLGRQTAQGLFVPMDDDHQAELIEKLTDHLEAAGYERYEISSYARPGREARHNSLYWVGAAYLGLGAGAHSYRPLSEGSRALAGARRWANIKSPQEYLLSRDNPKTYLDEALDQRAAVADLLLVGLRPRWGLDLSWLDQVTGQNYAEQLSYGAAPLLQSGLLERRGARLIPSKQGFLFNNTIVRTLAGNLTSP